MTDETERLLNLIADRDATIRYLRTQLDEARRYLDVPAIIRRPRVCSGCGETKAAQVVAWGDGMAWLCQECRDE